MFQTEAEYEMIKLILNISEKSTELLVKRWHIFLGH